MSLTSFIQISALRLIRFSPRSSFGFTNPCFSVNLLSQFINQSVSHPTRRTNKKKEYFVNPRPSMRTTIQVFRRSVSSCSKPFTYSNFEFAILCLCAFCSSLDATTLWWFCRTLSRIQIVAAAVAQGRRWRRAREKKEREATNIISQQPRIQSNCQNKTQ